MSISSTFTHQNYLTTTNKQSKAENSLIKLEVGIWAEISASLTIFPAEQADMIS